MTDEARREILTRVRGSCRGAGAVRIGEELNALGRSPVAQLPDPDLAVSFLYHVFRNRGSAALARDRSEAVRVIGRYLYERFRSHKLVAGNDSRLAALPWRDGGVLPRFGIAQDGDQAALSYASAAAAECGSVFLVTGKGNPASNNLLPEDHLVLVDAGDLRPDLDQALELAQSGPAGQARPRGINIISGPSSTGDIALQLVQGAHGPRRWHVVLVGDLAADTLVRARQLAGFTQSEE